MKKTSLNKTPVKPSTLTVQDVQDVIAKVAKNHRDKYFDIYDAEDIEHEVWLICYNILPKFEQSRSKEQSPKKALEHWLNSCVSKRLINFHRDKFVSRPKEFKSDRGVKLYQQKFNLAYPLGLDDVPETCFEKTLEFYILEKENSILPLLSEELIEILESYLSGEVLRPYYKNKLIQAIKELVNGRE